MSRPPHPEAVLCIYRGRRRNGGLTASVAASPSVQWGRPASRTLRRCHGTRFPLDALRHVQPAQQRTQLACAVLGTHAGAAAALGCLQLRQRPLRCRCGAVAAKGTALQLSWCHRHSGALAADTQSMRMDVICPPAVEALRQAERVSQELHTSILLICLAYPDGGACNTPNLLMSDPFSTRLCEGWLCCTGFNSQASISAPTSWSQHPAPAQQLQRFLQAQQAGPAVSSHLMNQSFRQSTASPQGNTEMVTAAPPLYVPGRLLLPLLTASCSASCGCAISVYEKFRIAWRQTTLLHSKRAGLQERYCISTSTACSSASTRGAALLSASHAAPATAAAAGRRSAGVLWPRLHLRRPG